jgi:hypothetical protein
LNCLSFALRLWIPPLVFSNFSNQSGTRILLNKRSGVWLGLHQAHDSDLGSIEHQSVYKNQFQLLFIFIFLHLRSRLLVQGYKRIRLIRSLKKFIFQYQYLVEIYSVSAELLIIYFLPGY